MLSVALSTQLRASVALFALAAVPALAQTAPAPGAAIADEEIVVTGRRPIAESEEAALAFQRESVSLVTVVASDSVGRLPDQNVAQAVSRLPGIGIQRDQGQARYVNLRGSPLNWTTLSFNGINVVSPEGRDARFDSLPSAIASKIVVQKAVTPDLSGETLAGNIDIITRSPFDYNGLHGAAKAGYGRTDLGSQDEFEGSLVLSNRWKAGDGEIGLLVSGSYYQRGLRTDNFENDWEVVSRDRRPGGPRVWARELENKMYRLTRRNWSASGRLEWQAPAGHTLFAESIYTIFKDDELRDNYRLDADDQESRVPNSPDPCPVPFSTLPAANTTGYADVCIGNTPTTGDVYGIDFDARFRETRYRQSVFTNTIGGDHDLDGGWSLRWRGNYTQSKDDRTQPLLLTYTQPGFGTNGAGAVNRTTVNYDLRDPFGQFFTIYRTLRSPTGVLSRGEQVQRFDQLPHGLNSVTSLEALDVTDAFTLKLEAKRETQALGGDTEFRFGAQYDNRVKERNEDSFALSGATNLTAAGIPLTLQDLLAGGESYRGKLRLGYTFNHFNEDTARDIRDKAAAVSTFAPVTANYYKVREEVISGYAMGISRFGWGNVVYGARIEHVKNRGEAFVNFPASPGNPATSSLVSASSSSTLVHPSAHLNYDLTPDMKLRLSFNTGASRPDYDQLRPSFTIDDANDRLSGGNPDARPERARGVDLYWEYYVQPRGYLSVGVYYKNLRDVLFEDSRLFGSDILNQDGVDRSGYTLTTLVNGGDGYIAGVEGAVQLQLDPFLETDAWWGGFGIQTNLAINTSKAETPDGRNIRFPGSSDWVFNFGPYYEKYGISARISYQKRTTWLSELGGDDTGGDIYWATDEELDASIRYAINQRFEVYVDMANLLNGPGRRFAGTSNRTLEHETFGRRFIAGVRFTY
jgi:TonB-dependent receptor